MPVQPHVTYPGVYIAEVPNNVRTITPVDTATTAFIGRALRGPVNTAVVCNSYADFERAFGGLWPESMLGFAVQDFFLNGGSKAVVVRAWHAAAAGDGKTPPAEAAGQAVLSIGGLQLRAKQPGLWGNGLQARIEVLEQRIRQQLGDPTAVAALPAAGKTSGNGSTPKAASTPPSGETPAGETNVPKPEDVGGAGSTDQGGQGKVDAGRGAKAGSVPAKADAGDTAALAAQAPAAPPAAPAAPPAAPAAPAFQLFNLMVTDGVTVESFPNVTLGLGPRQLGPVLKSDSSLVELLKAPDQIATPDDATQAIKDGRKPVTFGGSTITTAGDDGAALASADLASPDLEAADQGIYALQHADIFNMLVIPPYKTNTDGEMADVEPAVLTAAAKYCEDHRAILLVDPPSKWKTVQNAIDGFPGDVINPTANAAIFFPRIREANPLHDYRVETFAPSAAIAGVIARTDATRGVWKAPAGLEASIATARGLDIPLTDAQNGQLNPLGINCLRNMPAAGPVVWGARTMVGDDRLASQWKYLPVRRLALFIEESLYRGTQWAVFEPNDEPLWSQLRLSIGTFMQQLFRQGAFQGATPKDAYFVKCDATTTLQADIDLGIVNVIVGFAPLKPAEFVILYIQQIAGALAA